MSAETKPVLDARECDAAAFARAADDGDGDGGG